MKKILAYVCHDGEVFTDHAKALEHDEDKLGEELDGLLKLFKLELTRSQEHKALIQIMDNRVTLQAQLEIILSVLNHKDTESTANEYED